MNPFNKKYSPSIFNENISDTKMDIPNNRELYENVIKQALSDAGSDKEDIEEESLKDLTDEQIIQKIKLKFRKRVLKEGLSLEAKTQREGTRFYESMLELSHFSKIFNKLQNGMNRFNRIHRKA